MQVDFLELWFSGTSGSRRAPAPDVERRARDWPARWLLTPARRTEQMFRRIDHGLGQVSSLIFLWTYRHEYRLSAPRG